MYKLIGRGPKIGIFLENDFLTLNNKKINNKFDE